MLVLVTAGGSIDATKRDNKTAGEKKQILGYPIVDTGQTRCFNDHQEIHYPKNSSDFYGQDAQYETRKPAYKDNGDGTITDLNTGLIWQKTPDFVKRTFEDSKSYARNLKLAGYSDWRLPTIKELFSIADFSGNVHSNTPYIDTKYFDFQYPDTTQGWRIIDAQYRSSTEYKGLTMRGQQSVFGFNFADGRIKSYPKGTRGAGKQYVRCVRGNAYGQNQFVDMGDGTVKDKATGLVWMKIDSGKKMTWKEALAFAENLKYAGHNDWRLPDVKELQSIVDYSKAPDARDKSARGPAIDPVFKVTEPESWCWSSTTHIESRGGYYVCFGQGFSAWTHQGKQMNAHGAGAVRSDPKSGNPSTYKSGKGPQGDEVRIYNYVRCVRGGKVKKNNTGPRLDPNILGTRQPGIHQLTRNRQRGNQFSQQNRQQPQGSRYGQQSRRQPQGQGNFQKRFIQRLDRNGDNRVSRSEFDGPAHHFTQLDRNKDGYIEETEAPKSPPMQRRRMGTNRMGPGNQHFQSR